MSHPIGNFPAMEATPLHTSGNFPDAGDHQVVTERPDSLSFGCDECSLQRSAHCADCVVTYLCAADDGGVVVSIDELRLVRHLQAGGLAPPLRFRPRRPAAG